MSPQSGVQAYADVLTTNENHLPIVLPVRHNNDLMPWPNIRQADMGALRNSPKYGV